MSEITSSTLRRLMVNDPKLHEVRVAPDDMEGDRDFYNTNPSIAYMFPRGDVGWKMAGEIIGKNTSLAILKIRGAGEDNGIENLRSFFIGAGRNSSISEMTFVGWEVRGGAHFLYMVPLLENNSNLTTLNIWGGPLGNTEGLLSLASALSSCTHRLETLSIGRCYIEGGEAFDKFVSALIPDQIGQNHTLDVLDLSMNNIGREGCATLALLLSNPHCQLKSLGLADNNIDDEGVALLAEGLVKNAKLTCLNIARGNQVTKKGWTAITKTLCNKSCINETYLSNHTLQDVGNVVRLAGVKLPLALRSYLKLNCEDNANPFDDKQPFAPIQKILDCHHGWNMSNLIEEDLKMLPFILGWMDRAGIANKSFNGITNKMKMQNKRTLEKRRLMTIHQFVQRMPVTVVEKLKMHVNG